MAWREKGAKESTMEIRVKLFGHPLYPILIVFPLGLLATSVMFDVAYWATGNTRLSDWRIG
jgi:uncharacterized membrane protein